MSYTLKFFIGCSSTFALVLLRQFPVRYFPVLQIPVTHQRASETVEQLTEQICQQRGYESNTRRLFNCQILTHSAGDSYSDINKAINWSRRIIVLTAVPVENTAVLRMPFTDGRRACRIFQRC